MYLAIDVGNSNIHLGLFKEKSTPQLIKTIIFPCTEKINKQFLSFLKQYQQVNGLILSDSYGETSILQNKQFQQSIKSIPNFVLLTPHTECGLKIKYQPKSSLGTDRIANCVAAYTLYKKDCLIVDFGTATTFNLVLKSGEFKGGLITPGIMNLIKSYPSHLTKNYNISGKFRPYQQSTQQAIKSGIYFTVMALIEKVLKEMEASLKTKLYTTATGWGIKLIPGIKNIFNNIDANLTLKGLAIIFQKIFQPQMNTDKKNQTSICGEIIKGVYND